MGKGAQGIKRGIRNVSLKTAVKMGVGEGTKGVMQGAWFNVFSAPKAGEKPTTDKPYNSCMPYSTKNSVKIDYLQGYFQGQSVDPTYNIFTGY